MQERIKKKNISIEPNTVVLQMKIILKNCMKVSKYGLRLNYRAIQNMMLDENYTVYNVFIYYVEV